MKSLRQPQAPPSFPTDEKQPIMRLPLPETPEQKEPSTPPIDQRLPLPGTPEQKEPVLAPTDGQRLPLPGTPDQKEPTTGHPLPGTDTKSMLGNALGQLGQTFSQPDEEPMQVPNLITQGILPKNPAPQLPIAQPKFSPQLGEAALL